MNTVEKALSNIQGEGMRGGRGQVHLPAGKRQWQPCSWLRA